MFDIRLTTEIPAELEQGQSAVYGSIRIGDFNETFVTSLAEWPPERYERQWREAAQRLVSGAAKSAFVTSFAPPNKSFYFVWWVCYRVGETLYVQNQLVFYERIPSFAVEHLYDYLDDRKTVTDEGETISEWELPLESVRNYVTRIGS